ncbi:MAG: DEAD/DEAH box helicase [Planctomycetota bacterium]
MLYLSDDLTAPFSRTSRTLGEKLFRHDLVQIDDLSERLVTATIALSRSVKVHLSGFTDPDTLRPTCSCSKAAKGTWCEHAFALLLAVDALLHAHKQMLEDAEPGEFSEFSESAEGGAEPQRANRNTPQRSRKAAKTHTAPQIHSASVGDDTMPAWRRRLAPLEASMRTRTPAPILHWHIEPRPWAGMDSVMIINVLAQTWRKRDRCHGEAKASSVPIEMLGRLRSAEQALLPLYSAAANPNTHGWTRKSINLGNPWLVSAATAQLVLRALAELDNVWMHDEMAPGSPTRARIDIDPPFVFELQRQSGPANSKPTDRVQFAGTLRRDGEELPLHVVEGLTTSQGTAHGLVFQWSEGRILRVDIGESADWIRCLGADGPLEVPKADVPKALAALAPLPDAERVLRTELDQLPAGHPIGTVVVHVPKNPVDALRGELHAEYDDQVVALTSPNHIVLQNDAALLRNRVAERKLLARVAELGFDAASGTLRFARNEFAQIARKLIKLDMRVLAQGQPVRSMQSASASVATGIDWFEIGGTFEFSDAQPGGYQTPLPELLRRKITPDGMIELGDGSFGLLPETWMQRLERLRLMGATAAETDDEQTVRVPSSQLLLLDSLLSAQDGNEIRADRKLAAARRRIAEFEKLVPAEPPKSFTGELRNYQKIGLNWLAFLRTTGLGGCLADDMGLGKTVQLLAHLAAVCSARRRGSKRPSLLVAPRSVLGNWLAEAKRFTPNLRVVDFGAPDRWQAHGERIDQADLLLTTYGLLRGDAVAFTEREQRFDTVILDEAHAIKNANSQTAKAVRLLRADQRIALTGTPVENHLGELWSLFEFLNPGMLGRLPAFRTLFGGERKASELHENRDLIQRALRPVMLRRTKSQVLKDLPEKVEQVLWCDLEDSQRTRYNELRDHYREQLLAGNAALDNKKRFVALEALLRLRQAACHEGLLDRKRRGGMSSKFETLLPRIAELADEGHKVLIFSQFVSLLDLLAPRLQELDVRFERLDGRTRKRQERIDRFLNDPDCCAFLISLKAGGTGLNLTAADYVFVLDPWWNPAAEQQAIDRAHRIGQKHTVHAYRMVCRDTVEERVVELQDEKRQLAEAVLGNERSLLQNLTRDDLERLLG